MNICNDIGTVMTTNTVHCRRGANAIVIQDRYGTDNMVGVMEVEVSIMAAMTTCTVAGTTTCITTTTSTNFQVTVGGFVRMTVRTGVCMDVTTRGVNDITAMTACRHTVICYSCSNYAVMITYIMS